MALHETAVDTLVGAEVTDGHGRSREIMLEGRLAPATGGVQWVPWVRAQSAMAECAGESECGKTAQGNARDAKRSKQQALKHAPGSRADPNTTRLVAGWYPPMLADTHRAALYEQAIKQAIADFTQEHGRAPVVLDIGAGCGLLSMLAIRHGAKHAFAVEQFQGLATVAATVIETNGFTGSITVLAKASFEVTAEDLHPHAHEGRCDLVVSELLDFSLFGEMAVPILRDAYARLAHPCAPSIPAAARLYGRVISSPALHALRLQGCAVSSHCLPCHQHGLEPCDPVSDTQLLATVAFDPRTQAHTNNEQGVQAEEAQPEPAQDKDGGGEEGKQAKEELPASSAATAAAPARAARVEFEGQGGALQGHVAFDLWQGKAGKADGLQVWWELDILSCNGADLTYSSAPVTSSGQPYQDHWTQGVFVLPALKSSSKGGIGGRDSKSSGDEPARLVVCLGLDDDLTTLRMRPQPSSAIGSVSSEQCRALDAMLHAHGTLERGAAYGSGVYGRLLVRAMRRSKADARILRGQSVKPGEGRDGGIVLDISEGGACGLLYARHVAAHGTARCQRVVIYDAKRHALVCPRASEAAPVSASPLPSATGAGSTTASNTTSSGGAAEERAPLTGDENAGHVGVSVWRGAEYGEGWDPSWGTVQHLVGDTFAHQLRTRPILAALNMAYLRTALSPVLAPGAAFTPSRIHIRAALVSLPELAPCHAPLSPVCGLDHTPLEHAMRATGPDHPGPEAGTQPSDGGCGKVGDSTNGLSVLVSMPLWQYRRALVSAPATLAALSMEQPLDDLGASPHYTATLSVASSGASSSGSGVVGAGTDGVHADAVVLWVDLETGRRQDQEGAVGGAVETSSTGGRRPPVVVPGYPFTHEDVQRFRGAMGAGVAEAAEEVLAAHGSESGGVFWTRQLVYWLRGSRAKAQQQYRVDLTLCHSQGTYTFACSPVV